MVAVTFILSSCAFGPNGRYVPPEVLSKPIGDLAEGIATFGENVQKETLAGYRRSAREDLIRTAIYSHFTSKSWSATGPTMTPANVVFCKPRYGYQRISAPLKSTTARGTAVKEMIKAPGDNLGELFKALGNKYVVDPTEVVVDADYDTWVEKGGKVCVDQVAKADPFATRSYIGNEFGGALAAGKVLFDTVWSVVKPALTSGLQSIDLERRNTAVQQYFSDAENVKSMKNDFQHVETFLGQEFDLFQRRSAGDAVAQYAVFKDLNGAHWKDAMGAANAQGCPEAIRALKQPPGSDNDVGIACLNKVFESLTPVLSKTLDAADKLDVALDKTLPKEKLSEQIDTVAKIARGEVPEDAQLKTLWAVLTRYAALYNTIKDTGSEANKKKITDAFDAFTKALQ